MMRHRVALALALAAAPALTAQRPDYAPVIAELERLIPDRMQASNVPGLSIALVDDQRLVWSRGFGHTDRTRARPVTDETPFSLQSISKTYTAMGVLLAVERGWLSLDDPLRRHVPGFTVRSRFGPEQADRITVRQLLSHWAGLPHEAPVGGNFDPRPTTFERHIESIADVWLMFPVGFRYSYSNLGIDLAGYAVQRLSGRPFADYLRAELFEPLGMTASTFDEAEARRRPGTAKGHAGDRQVPDLQIAIVPSGGMYSTARDMAKFVSFMLAGGVVNGRRLVRPALLEEMATPQFRAPGQVGGYGLGLASRPMAGATQLNHGGGGYGFSTMQAWIPAHQVGVVVLSNQHSGVPPLVADSALRMMVRARLGRLPEDPPLALTDQPEAAVDSAALQRLVGSYKTRGSLSRFELRDGALHLGSARLTARGPALFSTPFTRFRFDLDDAGRPRGVEMLNCCALEYWPYNDGPDDPPGPDRSEWRPWVGAYEADIYGGKQPMEISVKNGHLYTSFGGGQRLREVEPGRYVTPDGEPVVFGENRVDVGSRPFLRVPQDRPRSGR